MTKSRRTVVSTPQETAVRTLVSAVYAATSARRDEIAHEMIGRTRSSIDEVATDSDITRLLTICSIAATTITLATLDIERDDEPVVMPKETAEYARVLARRGFPITVLDHGYRLTHNTILRWSLEQLEALGDDSSTVAQAAVVIMTRLSARVDLIAEYMLDIYELEFESWMRHRSTSRSARIGELLDGRPVDVPSAEATLGYRLRQHHLAVIAWLEPKQHEVDQLAFERAIAELCERFSSRERALIEPRDERMVWAWIPLGDSDPVDRPDWIAVAEEWTHPLILAAGGISYGPEGFVRSHRQAEQAATVARVSQVPGPRVVPLESVGAVALMCADLDAAKLWVSEVLGPLALDDATGRLYRETLRIFLASGGSQTATANVLTMHKNSVIYRLHRIEEVLGRSVRDGRLELENALALCHWLGTAVLDTSS
jgi:hypothetical protein